MQIVKHFAFLWRKKLPFLLLPRVVDVGVVVIVVDVISVVGDIFVDVVAGVLVHVVVNIGFNKYKVA